MAITSHRLVSGDCHTLLLIFRTFGVILFGVTQAVVQGFSTLVYPLDAASLPNCVCV